MLCMILRLDEVSRLRLMELEKEIEKMNLPSRNLYGHITAATYMGKDEQAFIASCREVLAGRKKFTVFYNQIEVMAATWTLAVTPKKEKELFCIQQMVAQLWPDELDRWTGAGVWKPHTTLLTLPHGDIHGTAEKLRKKFVPFEAQVVGAEFSRVEKDGYTILDSLKLL